MTAIMAVATAPALDRCVAILVGPYCELARAMGWYSSAPAYYGPSIDIGIYGGRALEADGADGVGRGPDQISLRDRNEIISTPSPAKT